MNLSRDEDPEGASQSFFKLFEGQDVTLPAMQMPKSGAVHQASTVEHIVPIKQRA